jgi:formate hydrogenlyase transcriptional activator
VLSLVKTVASTEATVLILGETGTGKELIARAVHRISERRDRSFIKTNCGAIPAGLLESELFGHEKGAFTGAISQKLGRIEMADLGTLFLDEIGDIPLELQPKLLRVLQDQEFERLGGTQTIKVNVRLIAATNRDLTQRMAKGQFRSDLFYRLHVFPIHLPPLRDRRQDIPKLVRYFMQKTARRMGKHIDTVPSETLNRMMQWSWPGNIRELENLVERSVILTKGSILKVPSAELRPKPESAADATLETAEREHIIRVLLEAKGVIAGPAGAAARLGMKRTTLNSKMKKLGIDPRSLS